jgi:hypothetical protein
VVLLYPRPFQIVYKKEAAFVGRLNENVPAVGILGLEIGNVFILGFHGPQLLIFCVENADLVHPEEALHLAEYLFHFPSTPGGGVSSSPQFY